MVQCIFRYRSSRRLRSVPKYVEDTKSSQLVGVYYLCELTLLPVASKVQRTKPLCGGEGISQPLMSRVCVGGQ
jgi:hypothetical protein